MCARSLAWPKLVRMPCKYLEPYSLFQDHSTLTGIVPMHFFFITNTSRDRIRATRATIMFHMFRIPRVWSGREGRTFFISFSSSHSSRTPGVGKSNGWRKRQPLKRVHTTQITAACGSAFGFGACKNSPAEASPPAYFFTYEGTASRLTSDGYNYSA